ncbi:MAG: hypothetical protein ACXABY_10300 [Candidatus Thorarchaeota archaeon]
MDSEKVKDEALTQEEARRRAINPWLGNMPHALQEGAEELLGEATGSGWLHYYHYNPELIDAMQQVIVGHKVGDVVDGLLEGGFVSGLKKGAKGKLKKTWKKTAYALQKAFDAPEEYKAKK